MWLRLRCMLIKEFHQMLRDPRMRMVIFAMPVVQLTVLAFALTTDVKNIRTAILDEDQTPLSRQVAAEFEGGGYFKVIAFLPSVRAMALWLDASHGQAILHFPSGFQADIQSGAGAQLQIVADGTYNNDTAIIFNYARQVLTGANARLAKQYAPRPLPAPAVVLVPRAWYNPNLESKFYYVPGLIAVMLLVISMLLTSIAIVREKEIGTIEQVMVTPIRRTEFILGKTIPFLLIGLITLTTMFAVAMLVFGLRVQGSILLLYFATALYIVGNLGIALLVSASAHTQQQAMLTTFLILMPAVLLSGFIFPIRNMPQAIQYLTFINPVRWFLQILHGIAVRGVGFSALWPAFCAQAALALCFVALAVIRFKKTSI